LPLWGAAPSTAPGSSSGKFFVERRHPSWSNGPFPSCGGLSSNHAAPLTALFVVPPSRFRPAHMPRHMVPLRLFDPSSQSNGRMFSASPNGGILPLPHPTPLPIGLWQRRPRRLSMGIRTLPTPSPWQNLASVRIGSPVNVCHPIIVCFFFIHLESLSFSHHTPHPCVSFISHWTTDALSDQEVSPTPNHSTHPRQDVPHYGRSEGFGSP